MQDMKLMLVDDEARFLETTKKTLLKKNVDVITAESGEAALEILDAREVHVVILDVKMPGMDGIETLRQIKARHPLVEVIMLTGHATVESAVDGLKCGATDYVMKPADIEVLIQKARAAYAKRLAMEEKISMAKARSYVKSPRQILKEGV
ncbi:MAG: response regulator [Pseudomonadota bacterium]